MAKRKSNLEIVLELFMSVSEIEAVQLYEAAGVVLKRRNLRGKKKKENAAKRLSRAAQTFMEGSALSGPPATQPLNLHEKRQRKEQQTP